MIACCLLAGLAVSCGGGSSNDLVAMVWSGVTHRYGVNKNHPTITELLGPEGATVDSLLVGTYVVRGTYDL